MYKVQNWSSKEYNILYMCENVTEEVNFHYITEQIRDHEHSLETVIAKQSGTVLLLVPNPPLPANYIGSTQIG